MRYLFARDKDQRSVEVRFVGEHFELIVCDGERGVVERFRQPEKLLEREHELFLKWRGEGWRLTGTP